jgi:dTMP kinase
MPLGKLIAIEGVDGSGKRTQTDLLARALAARGVPCATFSFPRYGSFFGKMIARFLNGEFGPLEAVNPHLAALLYAGNRLEAKPELEAALAAGKTILADRYIASNLAHQGSRVPPERRAEFLAWLRELEYKIYDLPAESLVIYLRAQPAHAQQLVEKKAAREYTSRKHDLLESDLAHLEQTAQVYDVLAAEPNWVTIECLDAASGKMQSPDEIHRAVLAAVEASAAGSRRAVTT